jgi:arrestin-2
MGVSYTFKCNVASNKDDPPQKRNTIEMAILKLQYSAESRGERIPSSFITKEFKLTKGRINMELTLDRELYYHGEEVPVTVAVGNNSNKTIKSLKCWIVQHVEVT